MVLEKDFFSFKMGEISVSLCFWEWSSGKKKTNDADERGDDCYIHAPE